VSRRTVVRRDLVDRRRGSTLVFVALMVLVVGAMTATVFSFSTSSGKLAAARVKRGRLRGYAELGVANGYHQLWNRYLSSRGNKAGNYDDYASWLTDECGLADGRVLSLPGMTLGDRASVAMVVSRHDLAASRSAYLQVTSTATDLDGEKLTMSSVFKIGGKPYQGFGYGLLTRNIDCMMCHVGFNNVDLLNNKDASNFGSFPPAKVGITESATFRKDVSAILGGQLISRGPIMDASGNDLTTLPSGISSLAVSAADGTIAQSANGSTSTVSNLSAATPGADGALSPNAAFYKNYPTDPAQQTAGPLPTDFPSPFNGMDYGTWAQQTATGSLSGGTIYRADAYGAGTLPGSGNTGSIAGFTEGVGNGVTILNGTKENPILLDGTVGLGGDVIISGYVKGTGSIAAQGNMYVLGDLKYADGVDASGNRTYGVAQDGTTNSIALTAGGNVTVGNYMANKDGSVMDASDKSLLNKEIGAFNRDEWTKTQPALPDATGRMVTNPTYDPGYVPTYYTFNPGDPVYVEAPVPGGTGIKASDIYFDPATRTWQGKTDGHYALTNDNVILPGTGSSIVAMNSSAISNANFSALARSIDTARPSGQKLEIDALLYSSNMIFVLARGNDSSKGYVNLNGSIVAKNTAILSGASSAGAVSINFDKRNAKLINLVDSSQVVPSTIAHVEK
jgi:hypothetical protein